MVKTASHSLYTLYGKDEKVELNFHDGQLKAWMSEKRFIFMFAGTQGGKTSFCLVPGGSGVRFCTVAKVIIWLLLLVSIFSN